jgi:hypothetical protein
VTGKSRLIINFIAFQIGWFAAVLGGAHDRAWLGSSIALLVMLLHLGMSRQPLRELQLMLCVLLLGFGWDSLLVTADLIRYPHGQFSPQLAPVWIVAVWGLFATTLNVSLNFLKHRDWLAAAFGAIGAPLSFLAGVRLQALQFPDPFKALLALAIGWGLLMLILTRLAQRFDGVA